MAWVLIAGIFIGIALTLGSLLYLANKFGMVGDDDYDDEEEDEDEDEETK